MRLPFSIFVALRFIRAKKKSGFLSFIGWISMVGLIIGISTLILITSVMNGFQQALSEKILGMVPHASVYYNQGIDDWESKAADILSKDSNVIGVAPFITTRGMSSINGEVHGTVLNGIDYKQQGKVSILPNVMERGSLNSLQPGEYNIVMGKTLIDERGIKLGDDVVIMLVTSDGTSSGVKPVYHTFKLSGVFSVSEEVDSWVSYINMQDAAEISGLSNKPVGLRLKLANIMDVKSSADNAGKIISEDKNSLFISTWKQSHKNLYDSIIQQKLMMALLLALIIIVAIFNVVSALIMMTVEKKSEIAILKTFGASKQTVLKTFLTQGIIVGALGSLIGLLLGVFLSLIIEDLSRWFNDILNLGLFDDYYVSALPSNINWVEVSLIVISSFLLCCIASIYPSFKAANSLPVEGLKNEL